MVMAIIFIESLFPAETTKFREQFKIMFQRSILDSLDSCSFICEITSEAIGPENMFHHML
jgi:hypothetical protein